MVPSVANMSKRDRCIVNYSPVGILSAAERNILRLQDVSGWLLDTWLLKTELSMTELSSSSGCSSLPMLGTPISENILGEVFWINRVDVQIWRRVDEFSRYELSCWDLCWFACMSCYRILRRSSCFLFCSYRSFS